MLFYTQFWRRQADFDGWHEGQVFPVPPKSDTYDPNKWIEVTLIDIGKNIYSSIMCEQLFKTIIKHSVKCQFGSTPGVGCQDGPFTIKTSTYKTKIQYPIMGGTCRPSQGLKHPQLCTTRHHTGKIWHYHNTIPINKMHS